MHEVFAHALGLQDELRRGARPKRERSSRLTNLGLAGAREGVEESGFAYAGKADDSCFEHDIFRKNAKRLSCMR